MDPDKTSPQLVWGTAQQFSRLDSHHSAHSCIHDTIAHQQKAHEVCAKLSSVDGMVRFECPFCLRGRDSAPVAGSRLERSSVRGSDSICDTRREVVKARLSVTDHLLVAS